MQTESHSRDRLLLKLSSDDRVRKFTSFERTARGELDRGKVRRDENLGREVTGPERRGWSPSRWAVRAEGGATAGCPSEVGRRAETKRSKVDGA